jgi:hydrogenase small subunit
MEGSSAQGFHERTLSMGKTIYWMQGGGCGGDTWSLLNGDAPGLVELLKFHDLELLWHPALSTRSPDEWSRLNRRVLAGEQVLDLFCLEGSVINGPADSGRFDTVAGKPKRDLIRSLAQQASHVVAVGTCASFGGVGAGGEVMSSGLQYAKFERGGLLGEAFTSKSGAPVINLPGCPCHCDVVAGVLSAVASDKPVALGEYQAPVDWYGVMVHQGCTRNEYHEYRVEEKRFGEKGCLFFYMGCHGPLVTGPCNKILWNRRSSKTRVGVPCFGCTRPDFPQQYPFFETRNIEGIPIELPDGVSRAHYMAYKGMAAAAAPKRLLKRKTGI